MYNTSKPIITYIIASIASFLIRDSILMMCVRMYVSVMLRNVAVMSHRNVASMMRIRTPSIVYTILKLE